MLFSRCLLRVALSAFLTVGITGDLCAQAARDPRAARPYRGLFGGNNGPDENGQLLDLTLSLFGGYDDDVGSGGDTTGGATGAGGQRGIGLSSSYLGASAGLRYRRNILDRLTFDASIGADSSLYTDIDDLVATRSHGALGLSWSISPRTRLSVSQYLAYSPFYSYSVYPVAGADAPLISAATPADIRVSQQDNITVGSSGQFTHSLTSRVSLYASGQYGRIDFRSNDDGVATENLAAGAGLAYNLTRHARARLGYSYRTQRYGGVRDQVDLHNVDIGIDYSRAMAFSLTRRTQLSFSTGTAFTDNSEGGRRFFVVGDANLTHLMGRTWGARLTYARNLQVVNGFTDVFFYDSVSGTLGGYLGQRITVQTGVGVNWGQYGVSEADADNRSTRTMYATGQMQFALTQLLAVQGSYFYYRYAFDPGAAALPVGVAPRNTRQGVRVSLVVWLPLVR